MGEEDADLMSHNDQILVLGMFDLARLDRARAVRIHNLYLALQERSVATLLSGDRTPRRRAVVRYLLQGKLQHARAVYVEASTSTATETDLFLLTLARAKRIPLLVYIPDAQQLFPAIFPRAGWRVKLLDWGWRRSIAAYLRLADALLFPSQGLTDCFDTQQPAKVFPPAGLPNREYTSLAWEPPVVVYAGGASHRYGSDLLLDAMEQVVAQHPTARCRFVTGDADAEVLANHPAIHAPWLIVEHRTFDDLPVVFNAATIAVIPLRVNPYNDLAMPVKLFDYMSFGRPVVVTACHDMAALVHELEVGLVVEDTAEGLAQGIARLLEDRDLAARLGRNGYRAIQRTHSWSHRAAQLLQMVEALEAEQEVR
jgi:glycosyltransferase involved in cell wall biosynthesis